MASTYSRSGTLDVPGDDRCRAEVELVLASDGFRRSPKLSRLLRYLCDKQLNGLAGEITEYAIAFEALGRSEQFDPQQDAAVRVDTHHLRKKLKEYYAGVGIDRPIQIVIPNGQYAPQFRLREVVPVPVPPPPEEAKPEDSSPAEPEVAKHSTKEWKWLTPLIFLVLLAVWAVPHYRQAALHPAAAPASPQLEMRAAMAAVNQDEIRIGAGGRTTPYIDKAGRAWQADRYFAGGVSFQRTAGQIQRTHDPELFQNGRDGQFTYNIPLRPGIYELHLYFAETGVAADTLRSVSVAINEKPPLMVDVASDAGGVNTATMKVFSDIGPAKDGFLHLAFQGGTNFVNAIELLPGIPGKILPVRITARDEMFLDHLGHAWLPDLWAAGGRKSTRVVSIDGTFDAALYQWERFGHFTYSIPVAEGGLYTVILHFSETWFAPPNSLGGVGSRVFDVYCNGSTLLKGYDILKDAGGVPNRAVVRSFYHVAASPLGKIELSFVPIANYALINSIEVIPE